MITRIRKSIFFKPVGALSLLVFFGNLFAPLSLFALGSGNSSPETHNVAGVDGSNMVNTLTGDFSYNIPLFEIGGYPMNLFYNAGSSMETEASWVGLGWNLTPGGVNRSLRGVPDDFDGDQIKETSYFKPYGLTGGFVNLGSSVNVGFALGSAGVASFGVGVGVSPNLGFEWFTDTYKGRGFGINGGTGLSASIGVGVPGASASLGGAFNFDIKHNSMIGFQNTVSSGVGMGVASGGDLIGLSYSPIQFSRSKNSRSGAITESMGVNSFEFYSVAAINHGPSGKTDISTQGPLYAAIPGSTMPLFFQSKNKSFGLNIGVVLPGAVTGLAVDLGATTGFKFGTYIDRMGVKGRVNYFSAYGSLYDKMLSGANYKCLKDYTKNHQYSKFTNRTPYLPQVSNTPDEFLAFGAGLSEPFKIYRSNIGFGYPANVVSQNIGSGSLGKDKIVNATLPVWGWETTKKRKQQQSKVKAWQNGALTKLEYKSSPTLNEPLAVFKSQSAVCFGDEDFDATLLNEGTWNFALNNTGVPGAEVSYNADFTTSPGSSIEREKPVKANTAMQYLTAEEAAKIGRNKYITFYEPDGGDYVQVSEPRINSFRKRKHISEVEITNPGGARYVFGIPVYNKKQIEKTFSVESLTSSTDLELYANEKHFDYVGAKEVADFVGPDFVGTDSYFSKKEIPAYVTSYLVTEILAPNYSDITENGPTEDDMGDYVKCAYVRTNANFSWRTPTTEENFGIHLRGLRSDRLIDEQQDDDKVMIVYGEREQYYVKEMESKNEIAIFHISEREDGRAASSIEGGINTTAGNGPYKLDSISIYSKYDYKANGTSAIPIKRVHFVYDYSLCPGVPNRIGSGGKLTLKQLFFTYGNSRAGLLHPYNFEYNTTYSAGGTKTFSYDENNTDMWGVYKNGYGLTGFPTQQSKNDFFYTFQTNITDAFAGAWNLKTIELPSGGIINVEYESDQYSYVQDKPAQQMYKVHGFSQYNPQNHNIYPNANNGNFDFYALWNYTGQGLNNGARDQKPYMIIELPDNSNATYHKVIDRIIENKEPVYFDLMVDIDGSGEDHYERVNGFGMPSTVCRIAEHNIKTDTDPGETDLSNAIDAAETQESFISSHGGYSKYVAIEFVPIFFEDQASSIQPSPMTYAAWQFLIVNYPKVAYKWDMEDCTVLTGLAKMTCMWNNLWNYLEQYDWDRAVGQNGIFNSLERIRMCRYVDVSQSWVRLDCWQGYKYGGGHRVKSLTFSDNWNDMTGGGSGEQEHSYKMIYSYTTDRPVGNNEVETISSGVASYEPAISMENPIKSPISYLDYLEQVTDGPDDYKLIVGPICEQYYPAPFVSYSNVTVQMEGNENITKNTMGKVEYIYHTCKDNPTIVFKSNLGDSEHSRVTKNSNFQISLNVDNIQNNGFAGWQMFTVYKNDINGKPKAINYYNSGGGIVKSINYTYNNSAIETNTATQNGPVKVLCEDGIVREKRLGREIEIAGESYESTEKTTARDRIKNVSVIVAIPKIKKYSRNLITHNKLRYLSITRVISDSYTLKEIIAKDYDKETIVRNELYDEATAQVIAQSVSTNFSGERNYSLTIPAFYAYKNMGPAYTNLGQTGALSISAGVADVNNLNLIAGDELYLSTTDKSYYTKAWVLYNDVSGSNNQLTLVDQNGRFVNNGSYTYKVIRSGKRNMLGASIAQYATLEQPFAVSSALSVSNSYKLIGASSTTFSDDKLIYNTGQGPRISNFALTSDAYEDLLADLNTLLAEDYSPDGTGSVSVEATSNYFVINGDIEYKSGLDGCNSNVAVLPLFGLLMRPKKSCFLHLESVDGSSIDYSSVTSFVSSLTSNINQAGLDNNELYVVAVTSSGRKLLRVFSDCLNLNSLVASCSSTGDCGFTAGTNVNPYVLGLKGVWGPEKSYVFNTKKNYSSSADLNNDGAFNTFSAFWQQSSGEWSVNSSISDNWILIGEGSVRHPIGAFIEAKDAIGNYSSSLLGYNNSMTIANANLSRYSDIYFDGFEDYDYLPELLCSACRPDRHMGVYRDMEKASIVTSNTISHTGKLAATLNNYLIFEGLKNSTASTSNGPEHEFELADNHVLPHYIPSIGKHIVSFWIYRGSNSDYSNVEIDITGKNTSNSTVNILSADIDVGIKDEIEGWKRVEFEFEVTQALNEFMVKLTNTDNTYPYYVDDIRLHPFNSNMTSMVYDPNNLRLTAALDERNYAVFYEYNKEGVLVRTKRETYKGIFTIGETRNNIVKKD